MSLLPTPAQVAQTHLSLTPHHNMITTDSLRYARPDVQRSEVETWDVPTITEEIARLQNSMMHLDETQKILAEQMVAEPDDAEWKVAHDENVETISSQNRRIEMMKQVLEGKGIMYNAHYGVNAIAPTQPVDERRLTEPAPAEEGGGIHL